MGYLGFEPRTNRLKAEYSTIELATLPKMIAHMYINIKVFTENIIIIIFFNKILIKNNILTLIFLV